MPEGRDIYRDGNVRADRSGPYFSAGTGAQDFEGHESPKRRTLSEIVSGDPSPGTPEWDGSDSQKEFVAEFKRVNEAAAGDPRVQAVRADKLVGSGSETGLLSIVYNTFTDAELLDELDRTGATTPAKAIKEMRAYDKMMREHEQEIRSM